MRRLVLLSLLGGAGCGDPEIIVPDVLQVLIQPSHGSVGISPRVEGLVYFTHPVKDAAAAEAAVSLECRGTPPCEAPSESGCTAEPDYTVTYDAAGQVARLTPAADLLGNTCYVYIVHAGIEADDEHVGKLPVEVRASFQTR